MRLLFFTLFFGLFCSFGTAQENQSRTSKDKAFILDQTSPEQAVEILGKPQSDKAEKIDVLYAGKWIDEKFKKEKCRVLLFDKFEDLGKAKLTFLNEKLVAINFLLEKDVQAAQLSTIYKIKFIPVFNDFGLKSTVNEFEKESKDVAVINFPRVYYLIGTSKSSVLTARVFNDYAVALGVKREPKWSPENKMKTNPVIGRVTDIQILSRTIFK
jgi:hypothetical protein